MKNIFKIFLYTLSFISYFSCINAGFTAGTLVQTPHHSFMPIELLDVKDEIISSNLLDGGDEDMIIGVSRHISKFCTRITIGDEIIYATDDQKFYLPHEKRWCEAQDLKPGQFLLKRDFGTIRIDGVQIGEIVDKEVDFFDLAVKRNHTYCVSRHEIVVYN